MNISFLKDAYRLIDPAQRKRGIGIVLLLVVSSVLDFFSIAFFLPLLFILIDPITIQTNFTFQAIYTHIGFQSLTVFAITFTVFVFVFIVFKTIINSWIDRRWIDPSSTLVLKPFNLGIGFKKVIERIQFLFIAGHIVYQQIRISFFKVSFSSKLNFSFR